MASFQALGAKIVEANPAVKAEFERLKKLVDAKKSNRSCPRKRASRGQGLGSPFAGRAAIELHRPFLSAMSPAMWCSSSLRLKRQPAGVLTNLSR